jgi:hypothetical protein
MWKEKLRAQQALSRSSEALAKSLGIHALLKLKLFKSAPKDCKKEL